MRRTKIMGTIGPASRKPKVLRKLIRGGLDIVRLNFSHIEEEHYEATTELIRFIRQTAAEFNKNVAIFQDLGGIKLRIGKFNVEGGVVYLPARTRVYLRDTEVSDNPRVIPFPYPDILESLCEGDRVYFADGMIRVDVVRNDGEETDVEVLVRHGGPLSSHKGINLPNVPINRPGMTEKDERDIEFGVKQGVDWVGVSFVRDAEDMRVVKTKLQILGSKARVMAKLEKAEGLRNFRDILEESDGIMVARGDMGIEIPMEKVPRWQVKMVRETQEVGKVCIVATQMFASMVFSPRPTRAECSDAFNAVWCGAGILLSDEMAVGEYPVEVLKVADRTIREAEVMYAYYPMLRANGSTEITVRSACQQAQAYKKSKIVVITTSGRAAIELAKHQPKAPIIALSHTKETLQSLAMVWGVQAGGVITPSQDMEELISLAVDKVIETGYVNPEKDMHLVMTFGYIQGISGTTNTTMYINLPEYLVERGQRKQPQDQEFIKERLAIS